MSIKPFELEAPRGGTKKLTIGGEEVLNVARVSLDVPARGVTRMVVEQVYLDGHATGEAEVRFIRRVIGRLPQPDTSEPPAQEVKDSLKELAHDLLATADLAEVIGGGTVTLEDGRKAHVLYAITSPHKDRHDRPG